MMRPQTPYMHWALDKKTGKKVFITPQNAALYRDATRFIKLHNEPVPTETQEIIKIVDAQTAAGIEQGDFDEQDVEWAAEGASSRRINIAQNQKAMAEQRADEAKQGSAESYAEGLTTEGVADISEVEAPAEAEPEVAAAPAPKKKAAKKKRAVKKAG